MGDLYKKIKSHKWYKSNVKVRDSRSRKVLEELSRSGKQSILPGQLIMFDYFEPKGREELEYYDAMPVTIFFGKFKSKEGVRVLGFNIHYYPPRIRYKLMDFILEHFKDSYKDEVLNKSVGIKYAELLNSLQKAKLDFGVRMYDPNLMRHITPIPKDKWPEAVFTEGAFKKRTRDAIIKYWNNFKS